MILCTVVVVVLTPHPSPHHASLIVTLTSTVPTVPFFPFPFSFLFLTTYAAASSRPFTPTHQSWLTSTARPTAPNSCRGFLLLNAVVLLLLPRTLPGNNKDHGTEYALPYAFLPGGGCESSSYPSSSSSSPLGWRSCSSRGSTWALTVDHRSRLGRA